MILVLKRKTKNLRFVWLRRNDINICRRLNIDVTSVWRNGALDSSWSWDLKEMLQVCQGTGSKRGNSGIRNTIIVCSVRGSDKLNNGMMKWTTDDLSPALSPTWICGD